MKKTKEEAAHTKENIFQAGLRVFSQKGFAASTIGDIARESKYTRGAIYWHFESKDAIFLELFERITSHVLHIIQTSFEGDASFIQNFRNTIEALLFRFKEDDELRMMEELLMFSSEAKRFIGLYTSHNENIYSFIAPVIQSAIDDGEIRNFSSPRIVFNILSTFMKGIMEHIICDVDISKDDIHEMIDVLVRGITSDKTKKDINN